MRNRSGWAFGDHGTHDGGPSAYLTILGSAYTAPELYGTREEAEEALAQHPARNNPHMNMVVAHVTETPHGGVNAGRGAGTPTRSRAHSTPRIASGARQRKERKDSTLELCPTRTSYQVRPPKREDTHMRKTVTVILAGLLAAGTIAVAAVPASASVNWQQRTCTAFRAWDQHRTPGRLTTLVIDSTHLGRSYLKADIGQLYADASSPGEKAAKYVAKDLQYMASDCA